MNLIDRDGWLLRTYRWHSVNVLPSVDAQSVCDDAGSIVGRALTVCMLGRIVDLQWPSRTFELSRTWLRPAGPAWNRKRRRWYWLPKVA
jgi:hypothetical protein